MILWRDCMSPLLLTLALLPAAPAQGVSVQKRGRSPLYLHVDGALVGAVSRRQPLSLPGSEWDREIAVSLDAEGTYLLCLATLPAGGGAVRVGRSGGCKGLGPHDGRVTDTVVRGGVVLVRGAELEGWLMVDGGGPWYPPGQGVTLNLAVGAHEVQVGELCGGVITIELGEVTPLVISALGCVGFDPEGLAPAIGR